MIGRRRAIALLAASLLVASACSGGTTTPIDPAATTPGTTPETSARGPAVSALPDLLVEVTGQVLLRRSGWADFLPVSFGTGVQPGDLLQVAAGGAASVFCGDEAEWDAPPIAVAGDGAPHGVPCPSGRPPRPWADVAALRGADDLAVPYVVRPRNTELLEPRPSLRWHRLDGADTYLVTVLSDDGADRPAVDIAGDSTPWPDSWDPMQPGATYILVIEAAGRRSDEDNPNHAGLGFTLMPDDRAAAIRAQAGRLTDSNLGSPARDVVIAELFLAEGLLAEATAALEQAAADNGSAAVLVALGRAHLAAGAVVEAQTSFALARDGAAAAGELESEAHALVGLGLAARAANDDAAAAGFLADALSLYERVGDQAAIDEVTQLLGT